MEWLVDWAGLVGCVWWDEFVDGDAVLAAGRSSVGVAEVKPDSKTELTQEERRKSSKFVWLYLYASFFLLSTLISYAFLLKTITMIYLYAKSMEEFIFQHKFYHCYCFSPLFLSRKYLEIKIKNMYQKKDILLVITNTCSVRINSHSMEESSWFFHRKGI